jgi:RNA polymerase sigma-70 factor (ECF subfamily)
MDWITTSTVLANLRDFDNRPAWDRFVSRFRQPICRFACTIGLGESEADDVAQETLAAFAESYRNGQYDRTKGRLSQWLFGIAYRKAQDERRRGARHPRGSGSSEVGSLSQIAIADEASLWASWDREWEQSVLDQCLEQVRREVEPTTYKAFEMVMRGDQSPTDAAQSLGVTVKLIYNAKHRVLKRIRELREELESVA